MVATDENALICDFAETYHIYDWRQLPARYAATLAAGLRPDARIVLKLNGSTWPMDTLLLASIADSSRVLVWQRSQAAADGQPPPPSLFKILFGKATQKNSPTGFATGGEFFAWREKMLNGGGADA